MNYRNSGEYINQDAFSLFENMHKNLNIYYGAKQRADAEEPNSPVYLDNKQTMLRAYEANELLIEISCDLMMRQIEAHLGEIASKQ